MKVIINKNETTYMYIQIEDIVLLRASKKQNKEFNYLTSSILKYYTEKEFDAYEKFEDYKDDMAVFTEKKSKNNEESVIDFLYEKKEILNLNDLNGLAIEQLEKISKTLNNKYSENLKNNSLYEALLCQNAINDIDELISLKIGTYYSGFTDLSREYGSQFKTLYYDKYYGYSGLIPGEIYIETKNPDDYLEIPIEIITEIADLEMEKVIINLAIEGYLQSHLNKDDIRLINMETEPDTKKDTLKITYDITRLYNKSFQRRLHED